MEEVLRASGVIVLRVPLGIAAEYLYGEFSKRAIELLGSNRTPYEYVRYFKEKYSEVLRDGAVWVLVATEPLFHVAEVHVYTFGERLRTKERFFTEVLSYLESEGKKRIWTSLSPRAGHTVRKELRQLGFTCEGIMGAYYYLGPTEGYADGELWARITNEKQGV